jgi:hypothetical protein
MDAPENPTPFTQMSRGITLAKDNEKDRFWGDM